jgi:hypothetical protein
MNVYGELSGASAEGGGSKYVIYTYIYFYVRVYLCVCVILRNKLNTVEKGEGEKRKQIYNGGVNVFKVHCSHVWNHHNEPSCIIKVC